MNGEEQQPGGRLGQLRERLAQRLDEGDRRETVKDRKDGHSWQFIDSGVWHVQRVFGEISHYIDPKQALVENETMQSLVNLPIGGKSGSEARAIIEEGASAHTVRVALAQVRHLINYVINPDRYTKRLERSTPPPRVVLHLIERLFDADKLGLILLPHEDPSPSIHTVNSAIGALQNLRGRMGELPEEERAGLEGRIEADLQKYHVMAAFLELDHFREGVISGRKEDQERAQAENGK